MHIDQDNQVPEIANRLLLIKSSKHLDLKLLNNTREGNKPISQYPVLCIRK